MTETALAPEADIAYEQLVQRNSELEEEKATLAEELEHAQGQRDAAIRRAQVAEGERDALRAHVEALNDKLGEVRDGLYGQGLQVAGWHLNGELEPLDSWFEDNDWEPVPFHQDSLASLVTPGVAAIGAERRRQIDGEGWSPDHDDRYQNGELPRAAACYAYAAALPAGSRKRITGVYSYRNDEFLRETWPWLGEWWKATTPRRDLEKAGALIAAELERLERMEGKQS